MYTCFERETKRNIQKKVQRIVIHPEYKKLQNPVVEMYFISHRQPTVFVYRQFRRLIRPCRATSLFSKFFTYPAFFFRFNRDKSGPFRASSPAFPNSSWRISYMRFFFSVRKLINIFRHVRHTVFIMTKAEYLKYKGGHFRVNGLFSVRFYVPPIAVFFEDRWPTVFSFPPVVFRYDESWLRSPCRACGLFSKILCLPRVLFPLKDSVDLNTKNNCQTEKKKTLRNIDTKNTYLNDAFENGTISVYK